MPKPEQACLDIKLVKRHDCLFSNLDYQLEGVSSLVLVTLCDALRVVFVAKLLKSRRLTDIQTLFTVNPDGCFLTTIQD